MSQIPAKIILKKFFDDPKEEEIVFLGSGRIDSAVKSYEELKGFKALAEGSYKVIHYQRGEDKKFYPINLKENKFFVKKGDILHLAYLPHGAEVLSGTLSAGVQGAAFGATVGTLIPGVGTAIGAAVGGAIGLAVGFFASRHEVNTRRSVQANVNNAMRTLDYVQKLRSIQPVRITPPKKLESKQLDKVYNDKRVNPGDFVPEIFGTLRIKPNAITPLYQTDKEESFTDDVLFLTSYDYQIIYSLGAGDLLVDDDKIRYNRRKQNYYDFDLSRLTDRVYKGRDEPFTIRGVQRDGDEYEDYTETNFSGTDSSGLKISSDLSLDDSEEISEAFNYQIILELSLRAVSYSNNLVSGAINQGENWIFNYYEALKDSDDNVRTFKTAKAATDALKAGSGGVEFVNISPGGVPPGGWGNRSWTRLTGSGNVHGTIDNADALDANILAITDSYVIVKDGTTAPIKITIDGSDYDVSTSKNDWTQSNFGAVDYYFVTPRLPLSGNWNNVKLTYADNSVSPSGEGGDALENDRIGGFAYERGTSQFLAVYPKDNSKLPIYLFEKSYDETPDKADILPNSMTIANRRSNSTYELKILSPEDLKQRIFSDLDIGLRTQNSSALLAGKSYRIFRLAWEDIKPSGSLDEASSIDLDSLTALGTHNILGSLVSVIEPRRGFITIGEGNLTINAKGETFFEVQGLWRRRAPPGVPEYEDPPIAPAAEFGRIQVLGFDPDQTIRDGDNSEFSLLRTSFSIPTPNYVDELKEHTEDVQDYNERVTRTQERYLKNAQEWQDGDQEFNERFNNWISGVSNISILVERQIKRTLLEENIPKKTENPADIFIYILESWTEKIKIRTTLDEIIDKQSFLDWREFCNTENIKFSGSFDFDTTVFDALKTVAFVGFAEIDFSFGKMRMIIKRRRTVISQHFHARNLRNFNYVRRQIEVPDLLKAQFINKDRFYLGDEIKLYLNETDASTARDEESISLFGVTDRRQAMRYLTLQKNQYEMINELWTFETDLQGIVALRGDLVGLNYYEEEESNFTARVIRPILEDRRDEEGILKPYILGVQIDQTSVPELENSQRYSCKIITDNNINPTFNVIVS